MNHTGNLPWDKAFDEMDREYKELFPESQRRFTFTEMKKRFTYPKKKRGKK